MNNCYGQDCVIHIDDDSIATSTGGGRPNPRFARGAFGEISMALYYRRAINLPVGEGECNDGYECGECDNDTSTGTQPRTQPRAQTDFTTGSLQFAAIKTVSVESLAGEVEALRELQSHPNVVSLLAVYPSPKNTNEVNIATEYHPIDLSASLEWNRRRRPQPASQLSTSTIQCIIYDLLNALQYMHTCKNFVHNDIKPGNVLISTTGYMKVCDFGLVQKISTTNDEITTAPTTTTTTNSTTTTTPTLNGYRSTRRTGMTTLNYRSPEVLLGDETFVPSIDMYAVGVVLAELLLFPIASTLFHGTTEMEQLQQICLLLGTPTINHWSDYNLLPYGQHFTFHNIYPIRDVADFIPRCNEHLHDVTDLLRNILVLDPKLRWTSTKAFHHVWLQSMQKNVERSRRLLLQEELIPQVLIKPIIIHNCITPATGKSRTNKSATTTTTPDLLPIEPVQRQALYIAAKRRSVLSDLDQWE